MFKILYLVICLIIFSYKDIKSRELPIWWLMITGALIPVMYMCDYQYLGEVIDYKKIVISIIAAIMFILLSVFTSMIGEADGIIIGYVCLLSDIYVAFFSLFISFVMLAVSGGVLVAIKKINIKTALPYIPYLFVAYMLTLVCMKRG